MNLKLELGCGAKPTPGYLHHDRWKHSPHIDVAWDLERLPWPPPDSAFEEILATDVFEHLRLEVQEWLDECRRILKPGGLLSMRLPAWDYHYSYRDPTHRRVFHPETFYYWCPNAPGTVWQEFGRYYFGPTYDKWWEHVASRREVGDLRILLRKPL